MYQPCLGQGLSAPCSLSPMCNHVGWLLRGAAGNTVVELSAPAPTLCLSAAGRSRRRGCQAEVPAPGTGFIRHRAQQAAELCWLVSWSPNPCPCCYQPQAQQAAELSRPPSWSPKP